MFGWEMRRVAPSISPPLTVECHWLVQKQHLHHIAVHPDTMHQKQMSKTLLTIDGDLLTEHRHLSVLSPEINLPGTGKHHQWKRASSPMGTKQMSSFTFLLWAERSLFSFLLNCSYWNWSEAAWRNVFFDVLSCLSLCCGGKAKCDTCLWLHMKCVGFCTNIFCHVKQCKSLFKCASQTLNVLNVSSCVRMERIAFILFSYVCKQLIEQIADQRHLNSSFCDIADWILKSKFPSMDNEQNNFSTREEATQAIPFESPSSFSLLSKVNRASDASPPPPSTSKLS